MKYIFTLWFVYFLLPANAQKLTYDIFLFGGKIGQTIVERNVRNDSITEYVLNSSSEAHIFFTTRKISLYYHIIYKRGNLFSSYSKHTRNDDTHYTTIRLDGNRYIIERDKVTFALNGLVDCSTVKLFFAEPCSYDHMLSERLGEFREVNKRPDGIYEAEMSEGITYYYRYENGKLVELEMRKGLLGSIYLRLHK